MKNASKYSKIYALGSQGVFSMVIYGVIGFVIGYFAIDKNGPWPVILAIVGVLIGLVTFITYVLYLQKSIEKEKEKNDKETEI